MDPSQCGLLGQPASLSHQGWFAHITERKISEPLCAALTSLVHTNNAGCTVCTITQLFSRALVDIPEAMFASWRVQAADARVEVTGSTVTLRCPAGKELLQARGHSLSGRNLRECRPAHLCCSVLCRRTCGTA